MMHSNDAVAIRHYQKVFGAEDSMVGEYPEDFRIFCVGEFDNATGEVKPQIPARLVIAGEQLVGKSPNEQ